MFNEAFWFFYLVGVVADVNAALTITFFATGIAVVFWAIFGGINVDCGDMKPETYKLGFKRMAIVAVAVLAFDIVFPSETSLYAGAGQYVGESAELDETLLRLKELVDAKIEEALDEKEPRE